MNESLSQLEEYIKLNYSDDWYIQKRLTELKKELTKQQNDYGYLLAS